MNAHKYLEFFEYRDGTLYWKKKPFKSTVNVGDAIGSVGSRGYMRVEFQGKTLSVHRVIFEMFNGYCPKCLDHIDGDKLNNRIENLRPANASENNMNRGKFTTNRSGSKNVSFDKKTGKWRVCLYRMNRQINIGRFDDLELADLVAAEARAKYHGTFARDK